MKVKAETIIRTIVLAFTLLNQTLTMFGKKSAAVFRNGYLRFPDDACHNRCVRLGVVEKQQLHAGGFESR